VAGDPDGVPVGTLEAGAADSATVGVLDAGDAVGAVVGAVLAGDALGCGVDGTEDGAGVGVEVVGAILGTLVGSTVMIRRSVIASASTVRSTHSINMWQNPVLDSTIAIHSSWDRQASTHAVSKWPPP